MIWLAALAGLSVQLQFPIVEGLPQALRQYTLVVALITRNLSLLGIGLISIRSVGKRVSNANASGSSESQ